LAKKIDESQEISLNTPKQSFQEFPRPIYWLLFLVLWALLIGTVVALFVRWAFLDAWNVFLYAGLLGLYLWAERRAYHKPHQPGRRAHESLRYLLSLSWWIVMIGSPLEYAIWPHSHRGWTIAGVLLTLGGVGLRVWSVYTLSEYFSGHIEAFKGQPVIETGPYHLIRHPAYAGNMLQLIGMPLVVNAYGALTLAALVASLFLRRLLWEEEFLAEQIPGYTEYMQRTRRLIPGVW
jgi:protein-S-isoprenylcysteine O-methyltransferase Ste14